MKMKVVVKGNGKLKTKTVTLSKKLALNSGAFNE